MAVVMVPQNVLSADNARGNRTGDGAERGDYAVIGDPAQLANSSRQRTPVQMVENDVVAEHDVELAVAPR